MTITHNQDSESPFLPTPARHWIDGAWVEGGTTGESVNPATDEVLGDFSDADEAVVAAAIEVARERFETTSWRTDRHARAKALWDLATAFEQNFDRLALAITIENGKPLREAQFEVSLCAPKLRYFAALALTDLGTSMAGANGDLSVTVHEAIGAAGVIVPWNSPVVLAVRSFAPALAAGCTAVIKMPAQTALTNAVMAEVIASVTSLPPGILNIFTESGDTGAKLLVSSPHIPVISYTGSTAVGARIASAAGVQLKRVSLELGGKTPMIVFADANLDVVVPTLTAGVTTFAGQFCMTGSRLLVQDGVYEAVLNGMAQRLRSVKVGPAADPTSDMGPLIDRANVERVDRVVEKAIAAGAKVIERGGAVTTGPLARGAFFRPALLEVYDNSSAIIQEETFGPVLTIQRFSDEAQAIRLANDSEYGLAASIWTRDVDLSLRVAQAIDAGSVWINDWAKVYDNTEEGGFKQSGLGRLNGLAALEDFQEYKHIALKPGISGN